MFKGPLQSLFYMLLTCLGTAGCGGSPQPAPGNNAGAAAITAAAAGSLWALGGGCRLQGCPYGSYCNQKSAFCDVRKCADGCPEGTVCNEGLGRCQEPQRATPPND